MEFKNIVSNKKAFFQYEILEKYEAGIVLVGTEVKSLRMGKCSLQESYAIAEKNSIYIKNMNIPEYKHGNINNHNTTRTRKLLLHKREISSIIKSMNEKGTTLIPTRMYFKGSLVKIEIALCKGKKMHDKRETIKDRDNKRSLDRAMKNYNS